MKNWWFFLFSGYLFVGNGLAATYDATGNWDYVTSNIWNNCGEPNPGAQQGTDILIQKGDNFTLVGELGTMTGSVSGVRNTAVTKFFEEGGQTTYNFSMILSSSTVANGSVNWTWRGFGEACSGGWAISYIKQPQRPLDYDATGTWDYSDFGHWNNCGDPNIQPSSNVLVFTQNGNKFSVVDQEQRLYDGFTDGSFYTYVRSYPYSGGTISDIYAVPLNLAAESGDGTGSSVWNNDTFVCSGGFNFTIAKQTQVVKGEDIVVDFGGIGLWARMNDASWLKLNNSSPDQVVVGDMDGNGQDDVIADFTSAFGGVFVKRNLGGWSQLHNNSPDSLAIGDLDNNGRDDVIVDFGSIGLWARMNDASWLKLNNSSPDQVVVGDMDGNGQDDVIAVFGSGIFVKRNLGGWSQLHNFIPELMAIGDLDNNGQDDVIIDFGGIALWARMNDASWLKLHNSSPDLIASGDIDGNGADDVLATFAGQGLWQKLNLGGWSKLNNSLPDDVVTGDVNGSGQDDIIANFGSTLGGIFVKRDQGAWVKLHNFSPDSVAVGELDGP